MTMKLRLPANGCTGHETGERFAPFQAQALPDVMLEHYHRYSVATEYCAGRKVLDIASGEGYGSFLLAQVASSVLGVDCDTIAIAEARERYVLPNLAYEAGNCTAIPAADSTFDAVVSFETVEHITQQAEFIAEIKRVLKPGGLLLMSSPDRERYTNPQHNRFHLKELSGAEIRQLVSSFFSQIAVLRQSSFFASVMVTLQPNGHPMRFVTMPDEHSLLVDRGSFLPYYWIVLASDGHLPEVKDDLMEPPIARSRLLQALRNQNGPGIATLQSENQKLVREHAEVTRQNRALTELNQRLSREQKNLEQEKQRLLLANEHLTQDVQQRKQECQRLQKENSEFAASNRQWSQMNVELTRRNLQIASEQQQTSDELLGAQGELKVALASVTAMRDELRSVRFANRKMNEKNLSVLAELKQIEANLSTLQRSMHGISRGLHSPVNLFRAITFAAQVVRNPRNGIQLMRDMRLIRRSGLFDEAFYVQSNPDVVAGMFDPIWHYCTHGWREQRDPSPDFSSSCYLQANADVRQSGVNPFAHYILHGKNERRCCKMPAAPEIARQSEAVDPALLEEMQLVLSSGLFDEEFYRRAHPDVAASGCDPLWHFCAFGWREGRNPSPQFSLSWYLTRYEDVRSCATNPLIHYLRWGQRENRECRAPEKQARRVAPVGNMQGQHVLSRMPAGAECRQQLTRADVVTIREHVHSLLYGQTTEVVVA